ncbi:MAG: hypothetical protein R2715_20635 [Ilumatobacteraceae bacterium]
MTSVEDLDRHLFSGGGDVGAPNVAVRRGVGGDREQLTLTAS